MNHYRAEPYHRSRGRDYRPAREWSRSPPLHRRDSGRSSFDGRDSSPRDSRDRGHYRERSPSWPRNGPTFSSRPTGYESRTQPESCGKSTRPPGLPSPSHSSNNESALQDVATVFRDFGELVAARANLNFQRDCLDKTVKQRKLEYEKSMSTIPEFQSVPELQNKFRDRQAKELDRLELLRRDHDAKYTHTTENMATRLLQSLPLVDMKKSLNDMDGNISSNTVQSDIAFLKVQLNQINEAGQTRFAEQVAEMQASHARKLEEEREKFTAQLSAEREAFASQLAKREEVFVAQIEELRKQAAAEQKEWESRQEKAIKGLSETLETHIRKAAETSAAMDLKAAQIRADDAELTALRAENATLRAQTTALQDRVAALSEEQAVCKGQVDVLQKSHDECTTLVDEMRLRVCEIDVPAMDQLADLPLRWSTLENKVNENDKNLKQIIPFLQVGRRTESTTVGEPSFSALVQNHHEIEKIKEMHERMVGLWGTMLDELKVEMSGLEERVKALESVAQTLVHAASDVDLMKDTARKLGEDVIRLNDRSEGLGKDMHCKYEYLEQQFTSLEFRYNNISTKKLAERVLGAMEAFYPSNAQVVADIGALAVAVDDIKAQMAKLASNDHMRRVFHQSAD
ncbi:hypothetical protein VTK73DRAFT_34 [Phialemonium thermophilum]|uniref:Uncharacterized protein n=1 Tax=Phialemonium thermophilum TaxID=223376 RepID=A0ABR3Y8Q3_9PEZI